MRNINEKQINCNVNIELGIDIKHLNSGKFPEGWPSHWHEYMELIYIKSGSILLDTNNSNEYITAESEQLIILPPKQLHKLKSGKNGFDIISIFLDLNSLANLTVFSRFYTDCILNEKINFAFICDNKDIISIVENLILSHLNHNPLYTQGTVYQLLALLIENSSTSSNVQMIKIHQILDYIQNHYSKDLNIQELCAKFGYSEGHFCRLFKSTTKMTFSIYMQITRVEKVKKLLQETNLDINTISEKCGFSDPCYFAKCFKKYVTYTPTKFRKEMKAQYEESKSFLL